jgi:hypothetical protein
MGSVILMISKICAFVLISVLLSSLTFAAKFYEDDPVWLDPDQLPIPKPAEINFSETYDLLKNSFGDPGGKEQTKSQNPNTLGEVPDSSWFTNRMGRKILSMEELVRGSNSKNGPDISNPIIIITSKRQGLIRGFTMQDSRGDIYFLKFDPPGYPQLTTSSEVISTKFFHAFGYNVPENYITFITRDQLRIGADARVPISKTETRKMNEKDIDEVWKKVPLTSDGRIQAVASLLIPGEIAGQFRYYGTRPDDPNDIYPHQDRRELRGLRVFCAWLNHDDVQSSNTIDSFVTENGTNHIKHYLIDFDSTLGSGTTKPNERRGGNEYYVEWDPILKSAYTLGLWDRPWRRIPYPKYPSIGRIESDYFQPQNWKTHYPNPAFLKMENEDAFWATKIVMRFNDEMVRALVQTGELIDKEGENYLIQTLIRRRDKIVKYYLSQLNPLDEFAIVNNELSFKNLGQDAGLASSATYQYQWFQFDNEKMASLSLGPEATSINPQIPAPSSNADYLMVRIRTIHPDQENWKKSVDVYLHNGDTMKVVGIERED